MKKFIGVALAAACACPSQAAGEQTKLDTTRVNNLNEVVVKAVRAPKSSPFAVENIKKTELERFASSGKELPWLFARTPGVLAWSENGVGTGTVYMRMRGAAGSRINVTVDGVPLNSPEDQCVFWANMNSYAALMGSAQIQRGVGASTNGDGAFGGSVSLATAAPSLKPSDLNRVQDPNVANSLEGKVSGVTITPSAGGAGGASKIILRGNKSILGSSTPLIVVDGVPMNNSQRGQVGSGANMLTTGVSEGSDALSMINPDDIESINVLKGANAAALYGSEAANGVLMITTKKGREGKVGVNFSSNVTFDTPLTTPKIQNVYGAAIDENAHTMSISSWGDKVSARNNDQLIIQTPMYGEHFGETMNDVHLRNSAKDDVADFFKTGVTTNNSIALSGGTDKMSSYFSYGNSHANGMIDNNSYNRHTFSFRQSFKFYDRASIDVSMNYIQTKTKNRPGGGITMNPIYHLYMMPRRRARAEQQRRRERAMSVRSRRNISRGCRWGAP